MENQTILIGSVAALLLAGAAAYFLYWRKQQKNTFGNYAVDARESGGISGGIWTPTGGSGQAVVEPNWNNPFDMTYAQEVAQWVAPKTLDVWDESQALQMVEAIYQAKGANFWNDDDEQAVENIFQKQLPDKVQVAILSKVFWNRYQRDLWGYLNSFLSDNEMETLVNKPVRTLPNYQLKTF